MRRALIVAAVLAAFSFVGESKSEAAYGYYSNSGSGFWGRLMEMERAKNDFLLRLIGLR